MNIKKFFCVTLMIGFATIGFSATLEEIKASKVVKIGIREKLPPFSTQDDGKLEGFEFELAQAIGKSLVGDNGKIEYIILNAKDRIPMLENGTIDIAIANFTKTPERAKKVDFSLPYLSNTQAILTRKADKITGIKDLQGKTLLVIKGTTSDEFLQKNATKLGVGAKECPSVKDCAQMLVDGEGDGYIHTNILIAGQTLVHDEIEFGVPSVGPLDFVCAGVVKGNKELLKHVENEIMQLSYEDFFKKVYSRTFEPFFKGTVNRKHLLLDDLYTLMR